MKVLLVEDDEDTATIVADSLAFFHLQVDIFECGKDIFRNNYELPDIYLIDYFLTNTNGAEICKFLKLNAATKNIPVVLVSNVFDLPKLAAECGADGYLKKPFDLKLLANTIKLIRQN